MSKGFGLWEVMLVLLVFINLTVDCARRHKKTPVWLNPCRAVEFRGGLKTRHTPNSPTQLQVTGRGHRASPKPLRRLRTQVSITYGHLASITPDLAKIICNRVSSIRAIRYQYDWLPLNQSQWYRKHVKCLDKKSKVLILLPKFQEGLQRFAATLEIMRTTKHSPTTTFECKARRQKVLDELSAKLSQLLCELDKTMSDLNIPPGTRLSQEEADSFMPGFDRDITTGEMYDWGVLTSYENYVTEWHKIVRQVVGPKGDAKCPSRPHRNKVNPLPT